MVTENDSDSGFMPPVSPESDPYIGTLVNGRYQIQSLLGYGGWSMVYLAVDQVLKRDVAVKMLYLPFASDQDKRKRFELEARAASSLNHPNIATTFDYGIMPFGQPFMVMEYLVGESLAEAIERRKTIPEPEAVEIVSQVARALQHAHEKGILHRDIKPSNILVTTSGGEHPSVTAKVLDFGLAKWIEETSELSQLTETGKIVGTPSYMSPEQCRGAPLDGRSDIYSLGCTLYEALCGTKPFQGSALDCMHAHLMEEPPNLKKQAPTVNVSVGLEAVVRRAMAKEPASRIPSAGAFLDALAERKSPSTITQVWWQLKDQIRQIPVIARALSVALVCFVVAYFTAPSWLPLLGVKTLQIGVDELDPVLLESVVSDLERKGDIKGAEKVLTSSLSTNVQKHGANSQAAANSSLLLGKFYLQHGNPEAARAPLQQAVVAFKQLDSAAGLETSQRLLDSAIKGTASPLLPQKKPTF